MKKWTTTTSAAATSSALGMNKVSLSQVLSIRPHLNEIECWALLGQTAHALQDILLTANGRSRLSASGASRRNNICPVIYPDRVLCTTTGRIILDNPSTLEYKPEFIHPLLSANQLYRDNYSETELEKLGIYSMGKTILACFNILAIDRLQQSDVLTDLLTKMTSPNTTDNQLTLLHVLECVASQWKQLVGASPITRFVGQLCKMTLGCSATTMTTRPKPRGIIQEDLEEAEISHIEFSRLNSSSSSSGTTSPKLARCRPPPVLPRCSSPLIETASTCDHRRMNINNNLLPPKLPPKPAPRTATKRKAAQRNPSRLYRIVKPLAEMAPTPSPATNHCIGPEFIVMEAAAPIVLDLAIHHSRKDFVSKQVDVVMLNGQRLLIHVNAATITAGELLDNVLRDQDIKEASLFALATLKDNDEFWPIGNEMKISKVAPPGWKGAVTLYQRLKFFPDDVDSCFKDPGNKHQFYLQLRRDLLHGRYHLSQSQYLSLAGMALQVEFGDFSQDIHGCSDNEYFMLEHYLPAHVINKKDQEIRSSLVKLHKAHLGQSESKTEIRFCKEIQRLDNFGFHFFKVFTDKKLNQPKLLGMHVQGIFLYEISTNKYVSHKILASFFWHKITRIQYDTGKFQLLVQDEQHKLKYYVQEAKSKVMFDLASSHHQHSNNQLRLKSKNSNTVKDNAVQYKEPPRVMRSLKSRLLPRRQSSQHKLYLPAPQQPLNPRGSLRRSTTVSMPADPKYLIKRLAHYSSMADALVGSSNKNNDVSDKENQTPATDQNYRYKVYLEPEEDHRRVQPVQQESRPALVEMSTRRSISVSTNPSARRRSESVSRPQTTSLQRNNKGRRISHGIVTTTAVNDNNGSSVLRMGTRISLSALHRERLRLTSELIGLGGGGGGQGHTNLGQMMASHPPAAKKRSLDLDYDTMEFKSILPTASRKEAVVLHTSIINDAAEALIYNDPANESLSESLLERFDNMETDEAEPERQIVAVTVVKSNSTGKLGLKITGTPSGIYVDDFDKTTVRMEGSTFKKGDRIVAINGRSLENVTYGNALDLVRKSGDSVLFLVSQIKDTLYYASN
jgi:hypothetical protein